MLLLSSDVAFCLMVNVELDKSSELDGVGQEKTEHLGDFAHGGRREGGEVEILGNLEGASSASPPEELK